MLSARDQARATRPEAFRNRLFASLVGDQITMVAHKHHIPVVEFIVSGVQPSQASFLTMWVLPGGRSPPSPGGLSTKAFTETSWHRDASLSLPERLETRLALLAARCESHA